MAGSCYFEIGLWKLFHKNVFHFTNLSSRIYRTYVRQFWYSWSTIGPREKILKVEVFRWLENAILRLFFASTLNTCLTMRSFYYFKSFMYPSTFQKLLLEIQKLF